jgi:hypothetical protein
MAVVADSGGLYALYDAGDKYHAAVRKAVEQEAGAVIVPALLLAELDYLLREYLGVDAELDLLAGIQGGAYTLAHPTLEDLNRCQELIVQYRDLDLGLADASVVATAERLRIARILTLDQRRFRAIRPRSGRPFHLLPFDRG